MFRMIGNSHFVCLKCRRSVKIWSREDAWNHVEFDPCATCHTPMICVGKQFTTPRKKDDAAWKKLEWMISNGWRGYGWPTQPKMNLRQTQEAIAVIAQASLRAARKAEYEQVIGEFRRFVKNGHSRSKNAKKRANLELKRQEKYQNAVLESVANNSASPSLIEPTP